MENVLTLAAPMIHWVIGAYREVWANMSFFFLIYGFSDNGFRSFFHVQYGGLIGVACRPSEPLLEHLLACDDVP